MYFFRLNSILLFFLLIFSPKINAQEDTNINNFYVHVVNEKFGINNLQMKTTVDAFLKDVWDEALKKGFKDNVLEINKIAFEKLNLKSGEAKWLYDNGLRLSNPSSHIPTAHYDETLSSIAVYGDENGTDWQGQKHPLLIVYHNYVIEKNNLSNLQIGTDSSDDENIIFFEVSSEKINGKSAQDIFYQWTSAFAPEFIQGTEKEKYVFPFDKWRMALIYNDRVISTPYLYTALRDKFAVSTFNSQKIRLLNLKSKN